MILSSHTARQLRNASLSALYRVAYDHDVDLSDVMASITPSQPSPASQAPAASTPAAAPADVQAGEARPASSATPLQAISIGRYATRAGGEAEVWAKDKGGNALYPFYGSLPASPEDDAWDSSGRNWASADFDLVRRIGPLPATPSPEPQPTSTPAVQSAVDADLDEQERAIETGKPGEAEASPVTVKRKRAKREGKSIKQQVADAHGEHPDWSAEQIAEHTGAKLGSVRHALHDARTAAGTAEVEVIPPANPQTPVAPPPPPIGGTLKDRVRVRHQQHPTWTAALIAKDLGANQSSVSVYLAAIRREEAGEASEAAPAPAPPNTLPNQPAGSIEARLKADAAARRARLGAKP
jgi:hypothetical protein